MITADLRERREAIIEEHFRSEVDKEFERTLATFAGRPHYEIMATGQVFDGDADVTTGSGDVGVGPVSGRTRVRTGSGTIRLADLGGSADVKAGSGDVDLGVVSGDLGVRTGSGSLRIADARSGRYELTTGSGELRVGVHAGVTAEVDLSSGSGSARSDLEVGGSAPTGGAAVHVRGRTGSGDVLVTRAVPV